VNVPFLQNTTFTGLLSTEEYRTSKQWNEAYDIGTIVQALSSNWNEAYNITSLVPNFSAIQADVVLFSELSALKEQSKLRIGQFYVIADFQLKWWNPSLTDQTIKISPVIEPLLVQALSETEINSQAFSLLHPNDIIYYDINAVTSEGWGPSPVLPPGPIPEFKGWIRRRIDTSRNIDIGWDWRYITVHCRKLDVSSIPVYNSTTSYSKFSVVISTGGKLHYSIQNNNQGNSLTNTFWWLQLTGETGFIERDTYFPVADSENSALLGGFKNNLINLPLLPNTNEQFYTFTNSFTVPGNNASISTGLRDIFIQRGTGNVFGPFVRNFRVEGSCDYNLIKEANIIKAEAEFQENTIPALFNLNIFGNRFKRNVFSNYIQGTIPTGNINNIFGNDCADNIINAEFRFNTTDDNFSNNRIGRFVQSNTFDKNFQNNNLVNSFYFFNNFGPFVTNNNFDTSCSFNKLEGDFSNNNISFNFASNTINRTFTNNTIGDTFTSNEISTNFSFNQIGNNFSFNVIKNVFDGNTIGNDFNFNVIGENFNNNILQDNFNSAIVGNNIIGLNFTGATHVYNSYDKNIFRNFDLIPRLSFYNSSDQLVITDPTS
jgi:hypothetical protein